MSVALHFFTGENVFLLREERRQWEEQFAHKHGQENLSLLDGKSLRFRSFLDQVAIAPFLASKRLFVVDGVPSFSKEEFEALPELIHPDCVVLVVDSSPDKRLSGVKALLKVSTVKEFRNLQGNQLRLWMETYAVKMGTALRKGAVEELLSIVGDEQDMLAQEIGKIAIFCGARGIGVDDVRLLAVPSGEREVWHLTSLIAAGNRDESLRYASELTDRGEDPMALWNILLWLWKNMVYVCASVLEGQRDVGRIVSQYRVPMPTARTLLPMAERFSLVELDSMITWIAQTDVELKRGGYRYAREAPQEVLALIDTLIVRSTERR